MSKVTEELDFMWEKRVLDYFNDLRAAHNFEAMEVVRTVLKLQGLHVKGIDQ